MFFKKNGQNFFQKFASREEAGFKLAQVLKSFGIKNNLLVCAIPRGGVQVGAEIAKELQARLVTFPVKKIGAPENPELAIGAVGPWGKPFFDKPLINVLQIPQNILKQEVKKARTEVKRRMIDYAVGETDFAQQTVILTDDGVATGSTVILAGKLIKSQNPKKLILAVPLAPKSKLADFKKIFDEVVVLLKPADFRAVGQFYYDFPQVTDEEVKNLLNETNSGVR